MRPSWKEIRTCVAKFTDEWWTKRKVTGGFWIVAWVLFVLVAVGYFSTMYWDWLSAEESNGTIIRKSGSEIIRNLGLVVAAIVALPLAIWRSIVAERQATAAQRQAETAQHGLLNECYQKGAEMLGSEVLNVRLSGIYALTRVARKHPKEYHTQIMQLLCTFVRIPPEGYEKNTPTEGTQQAIRLREDVHTILTEICKRSEAQIKIETEEPYILDLSCADLVGANLADAVLSRANLAGVNLSGAVLFGTKLSGAVLPRANLVGANLTGVDLSHASLVDAKLSKARLSRTDLVGADLENADLSYAGLSRTDLTGAVLADADLSYTRLRRSNLTDAILMGANLTGADLSDSKGLTQEQLDDDAFADETFPPKLPNVADAETGVPLVWRGKLT